MLSLIRLITFVMMALCLVEIQAMSTLRTASSLRTDHGYIKQIRSFLYDILIATGYEPTEEQALNEAAESFGALRVKEEEQPQDAKKLCHEFPAKCPVNATLVRLLDEGIFNRLNVTFEFPQIPMELLDPCTLIADRGKRIQCVDEALRQYSMKTQDGVITQLKQLPEGSFDYYQNFSIMNRLIVKYVHHEDVVWKTALQPYVVRVYEEVHLPIDIEDDDQKEGEAGKELEHDFLW